jgi:hypothetical protein
VFRQGGLLTGHRVGATSRPGSDGLLRQDLWARVPGANAPDLAVQVRGTAFDTGTGRLDLLPVCEGLRAR